MSPDKDNSAINSFKLEYNNIVKDTSNIRYNYTCVQSASISNNCQNYSTELNKLAQFEVVKGIRKLSRSFLNCTNNQVMKKFGLKFENWTIGEYDFKNPPALKYDYTCCDAEVSDLKIFQTLPISLNRNPRVPTPDKQGSYSDLQYQFVNGKDFNAIKSFNLQMPNSYTMFYIGSLYVLKGETSPSFPDPCDERTGQGDKKSRKSGVSSNGMLSTKSNAQVYLGYFVYMSK